MAQAQLRNPVRQTTKHLFVGEAFGAPTTATTVLKGEFLNLMESGITGDEYDFELRRVQGVSHPIFYVSDNPTEIPVAGAFNTEGAVFSHVVAPACGAFIRLSSPAAPVFKHPWYDLARKYNSPEQKFAALRDEWKAACGVAASIAEMVMHPAYQQIIGMGVVAIPILLCELQKEPEHWFWALKAITGLDPAPSEDRGDIAKMAAAWLSWGRQNSFL